MVQVRWTRRALDDLDAIFAYIALDSPAIADAFARRIVASTRRLADFPLLGRMVPEANRADLREVLVRGYRVIYRVKPDLVEVLTVQHGARQLRLPEEADPPVS